MQFPVRIGEATVQVGGTSHESALVKNLMGRRHALLGVKDPVESDELFSELPRKAIASGGGTSMSYRVKWERVEKSKFAGSRCIFSVEESGLDRIMTALRRNPR